MTACMNFVYEVRKRLSERSQPKINPLRHLSPAIADSVAYLSSPEALESIRQNPYWPKWNSPWWHMALLHEMGLSGRIPNSAIAAMREALDTQFLHFFPVREEELPPGKDMHRDVCCHCGLGTLHQILDSRGVAVLQEHPWIGDWYLKYGLSDGGFNCSPEACRTGNPPSSIVGTIPILEALLVSRERPLSADLERVLDRGAECLISRELRKGSHPEEVLDEEDWLKPGFPRFYLYDVLRGLSFLVRWAELRKRALPAQAVFEVVRHLSESCPEGQVTIRRDCTDGIRTLKRDKGENWSWPHPASRFRLLDEVSRVGEESPFLTSHWQRTLERLETLAESGLLV